MDESFFVMLYHAKTPSIIEDGFEVYDVINDSVRKKHFLVSKCSLLSIFLINIIKLK
jgi:hypothetical protein